MEKFNEHKPRNLYIRSSIKKIENSIEELEKIKAGLVSMLPQKTLDPSKRIITLPGGKIVDFSGKEVGNGDPM